MFFEKILRIKDLIIKKYHIYIPSSLRKKILNAVYDGCQGIVKTKQLLRSKI